MGSYCSPFCGRGLGRVTVKTIADLKPDVENARQHNPRNIGMIADSLQEVGAARSIVIDEDNIIIAGNGVIEAAAQVGIENVRIIEADGNEIIAVRRSGLTPEQKRRLAYFDNRTAELATWDAGQIVRDLEAEINLSGIWSPQEFEDLVGDALKGFGDEPPEPQIDRAEELREKWQTARGQIWEIASKTVVGKSHRVMCGDSTSEEDVARLMGGKRAAMVFTDPPYNVAYQDNESAESLRARNRRRDGLVVPGDAMTDEQFEDFLRDFLSLWPLEKGGAFYLCAPPGRTETQFRNALACIGDLTLRQCIVWVKDRFVFGRQDYHWRHESILYGWRDGAPHYFIDDHTQDTVWEIERPTTSEQHPTMKPVELGARAIRNSSVVGTMAFDGFLGSGTTVIAAEQTGRLCYGCDVEPKYIAVTLERMQDMGLEPRLVNQCAN